MSKTSCLCTDVSSSDSESTISRRSYEEIEIELKCFDDAPSSLAGSNSSSYGSFNELIQSPAKYPKSVGFIISNEFCERFNYYGMRTILVLYLTNKLGYSKDGATVLFHEFSMLVYVCPVLGAIIADSWLGKFKTILWLSIVYAIGGVIVALGAIPPLQLPVKEVTVAGLILIAVGTGGIKPCVSAFGGDQFRIPEQAKQLAGFFSLFYFAINAGSMLSTSITPVLREDVHCFNDLDCYSLAFGVPAVLMLISVVIFFAGKSLYVMKPPAGNMILGVTKCITDAFRGWRMNRKTNPRKSWLDYAEATSGRRMVDDTRQLLKVLVLYLPFPVFWALFDQQGSRWTFQATRMDGNTFGYAIKPDQMQVINPLLIMAFIPLFDYVIYPLLALIGIKRPLQKLAMGGLLAAAAFLLSAMVELKLEAQAPILPTDNTANLRIYNGMPCKYDLYMDVPLGGLQSSSIEPLGIFEARRIRVPEMKVYTFNATSLSPSCPDAAGTMLLKPGTERSYFIAKDRIHEFDDSSEKPEQNNPKIRFLLNIEGKSHITIKDPTEISKTLVSNPVIADQTVSVVQGESVFTVGDKPIQKIDAQTGGVYTLVATGNSQEGYTSKLHTITEPNSVHMMWQLPQIFTITAAEIMFSVTGLEFSFTQAPQSMKSVLQACWLLSVAVGNMLVVVVAEMKFFDSQAAEFTLFAVLMVVDILIFIVLAMRYEYVNQSDTTEDCEATHIKGHRKNGGSQGHVNTAFERDDRRMKVG